MSLDIFPRISSNTNVAAPVEQEILLDINSGCGLFHRLPWFQLLELIERPGQLLLSNGKDLLANYPQALPTPTYLRSEFLTSPKIHPILSPIPQMNPIPFNHN
jgi:hypothetical protein